MSKCSALTAWLSDQLMLPIIVMLLVVSTVTIAAMGLYVPWYNHFVEGCLSSKNGTVLGTNLYAVAFNFAAHDGSMHAPTEGKALHGLVNAFILYVL